MKSMLKTDFLGMNKSKKDAARKRHLEEKKRDRKKRELRVIKERKWREEHEKRSSNKIPTQKIIEDEQT